MKIFCRKLADWKILSCSKIYIVLITYLCKLFQGPLFCCHFTQKAKGPMGAQITSVWFLLLLLLSLWKVSTYNRFHFFLLCINFLLIQFFRFFVRSRSPFFVMISYLTSALQLPVVRFIRYSYFSFVLFFSTLIFQWFIFDKIISFILFINSVQFSFDIFFFYFFFPTSFSSSSYFVFSFFPFYSCPSFTCLSLYFSSLFLSSLFFFFHLFIFTLFFIFCLSSFSFCFLFLSFYYFFLRFFFYLHFTSFASFSFVFTCNSFFTISFLSFFFSVWFFVSFLHSISPLSHLFLPSVLSVISSFAVSYS